MAREQIGRYEILETLGKGAMGVVYLAHDPIIDRKVALKTLRIDVDPDCAGEFRERFFREARAAGQLSHPGIVTIHDVGECPETGLVYIAMEYIKGQDLKEMLGPDRRLHPSEAARIVAEVALALDYAHNLGVIHRDIKPANIILTTGGTAKIMDFGVARLESSNLTVDGQFIGTPNFMAPEQITGQPVDARSDVFSLGVVLFTLLTGKRPFRGANMHDVTLKIVGEPCPIPSTVVPGIAPAFNPIVLKCLEKDPDQRYQSAAALAEALGALARVLAPRSETDPGRTMAASAPKTQPAPTPEPVPPDPPPRVRDRWRSLPIPDWLHWSVNDRWAWLSIGAAVSVLGLVIVLLALMVDRGPWPSPSDAGMAGRHTVVRSFIDARRFLRRGSVVEAEAACLRGLDQAPSSPGGRALARAIHAALEEEKTILAGRARVEALVDQGRSLYRSGSFTESIELFDQALAIDPANDLAGSYRELATERLKHAQPATPRRSAPSQPRARRTTGSVTAVPRSVPTPGLVRIELRFDSPVNSGHFTVTLDGESLEEIPFDFTTRNRLGLKRKGTGTVRRTLIAPSGKRVLGIRLSSPDLEAPAEASFTKQFTAGSRWSLRADLPSKKASPSFFLIRAD